ncbi:tetratricopeptide repeat domain-containing protein [Copromyces sp. CBS 386.78]|nr:tetratricopeptide repeat domain-containing protein [Copromyces sp. CBS 386.78]
MSRSRLVQLLAVKETGPNVNIILIPGVGTPNPKSWGLSQSPWRDFLASLNNQGVIIHGYDHHIPYNDIFTWKHILEEGHELLSALASFLDGLSRPEPVLFVCHGLGGAVLKQALCIANAQYDRYSRHLMSIAGIIFLGTPHRLEGVTSGQTGERIISILKLEEVTGSLSRQCLTKLRDSCSTMIDLASQFNITNLRVETLSVFEERPTKVRDTGRVTLSALRSKTKKLIIVDQNLCTIGTVSEQRLGVDLDHLQLVALCEPNGSPIQQIKTWLSSVITCAHDNLESRFAGERARRAESPETPTSIDNLDMTNFGFDNAQTELHGTGATHMSDQQTSTYVNIGSRQSSQQQEIETLLENFAIKQANPRTPCFMVETFARNTSFFGRDDVLRQLDDCLLPSADLLVSSQPDRTRIGLLCGMGGLGKTETAIEYAYSRRDKFDAIFWVRAEDSSKLETDIAQIAVRLGIQDPNEPDDKIINRGLALEWLLDPFRVEYTADGQVKVSASWLVIFDNADDPDLLAPYRDVANSGAVLLTSRSPLAKSAFSDRAVDISIQPFSSKESAKFLQKITGVDGRHDEAEEIGTKLGGLPLALAQMAGIIRLEFLTYTEFLTLYDDAEEEAEVHDTVLQPLRSSARGNLSTVWAIEKLSASARAILEISSFLDPDSMQESLFLSHAASVQIQSFPKKKIAFFAARKQLIGSSLFRHNQERAEYWMHRVTQDVVRAKIEPERRKPVFANTVAILSAAWPASSVGGHAVGLWELSEKLYPHITRLRELYVRYFEQGDEDLDVAFASLLNRAGWYQHERGESHKIIPILEMALELCTHVSTHDTRDLESDIRYTLGAIANETNDAESCLEHTKRFFDIRLEIAKQSTEADERLARSYNQIGVAWMMVKEYQKAEDAFLTSAKEYEKLPNYTKDMRSLALVNLGLAYWIQGKFDEATKVLELGLADREELYGVMDTHSFRTGRFLHALGNVRYSQGRIEESAEFHNKALQQYQSTIRNHHHRTADVCHKVAQHCIRNDRLSEALEFVGQALKVWSADAEKYRPEIARTFFLKAKVLSMLGQEAEAKELFEAAAALRSKIAKVAGKKTMEELTEEDFDELVTFWSR